MIKNLVISGGGISGIGLLGIIKYIDELDALENVQNYIGTSVGSILSLLLVLNYNINDLYDLLLIFDFNKLVSEVSLDTLLNGWGFTDITKLNYFIKKLIKHKQLDENITFKQLYNKTNKNFIVTGSCINDNKIYYFNHETEPDMEIIKAISISSCIPIVFAPIKYKKKLWVDGGLLNNYPIDYFKDDIKNTLGICIYDEIYQCENKINDIKDYFSNLLKCIAYGSTHNMTYRYDKNTIKFIHHFNHSFGFTMNKENKKKVFGLGYNCAVQQTKIIEKIKNNR
jgi:NTE family protein